MYSERLRTLARAYKLAERENRVFADAQEKLAQAKLKQGYVNGIATSLTMLDALIVKQENAWQESVLRKLEAEIMQALSYVYPSDGYSVSLNTRVLRGKVHVEGAVRSYFTDMMPGELADSQGCLFQQIVSFSALIGIMDLLHVGTVYVDEAFSGVAKANVEKINALLKMYQKRGYNIILIAQDTSVALGIEANTLILERSLDNKTIVTQIGGALNGA